MEKKEKRDDRDIEILDKGIESEMMPLWVGCCFIAVFPSNFY